MMNKINNTYLEYTGKFVFLGEINDCLRNGDLIINKSGVIKLKLNNKIVSLSKQHIFSRVSFTVGGLLEDLVPGSDLATKFKKEVWDKYEKAVFENPDLPLYGNLFYYPDRNDLVLYAPKKWHEIALLTRNSLLIRDSKQTIDWKQQREIFGKLTIGIAGASVGKNAFLTVANLLLPKHLKIADLRSYKDTNASRTALSYWEIGANKAEVAASQIHANNPYMPVSVYNMGLNSLTAVDFIVGNNNLGEPKLDYLIEETDDPDIKISGRTWARNNQVPVLMISDIGVGYQIDFRDFKKNPKLPLAVGVSDKEVLEAQNLWHKDKANRELFFKFAFKLIGDDWQKIPEFKDLVLKKTIVPFGGGIPQLGIAAQKGAADLALMIALNELGAPIPERYFVDSRSEILKK